MTNDPRDTPVSCDNPDALARYETALQQYQSYVGDPLATIDAALAEQPDFVLGHIFRAGVLMSLGEKRFARQAADSVATAEALAPKANDRERGLAAAVRRLVEGDWHGGCGALDAVLVDYPRDAFAAQTAHLFDFYRGDALNLRNRLARVLTRWSPAVPGWSYLMGMYAFGLEECNQYDEAEDAAMRALDVEPRDGWSVHAVVHCMEMTGRIDDGIEWLETRANDWAPDNGFAFHNWWHLALFHLDRGDDERVLRLYDEHVDPGNTDMALQLVDATSLLWRLRLLGIDIGGRFEALARTWEAKLEEEAGFYAFNDAHAVMAFAATGRFEAAERVLEDTPRSFGGDVGPAIGRALLAFEQRRWDECIDLLAPVRDIAHRFGGSHAQRDLLTLTLVEAARRAARPALARHLLAERRMLRPSSALFARFMPR